MVTVKPTYRVQAQFIPHEQHYQAIGDPKPSFIFDSDAQLERLVEVDYGEGMNSWNPRHGRYQGSYRTFLGQMVIGGRELGPRVKWREFTYAAGGTAIIGRIANDHLDPMFTADGKGELPPLGRMRGALKVSVSTGAKTPVEVVNFPATDPTTSATIWDKAGICFSHGEVKLLPKMEPFLRIATLFGQRTPTMRYGAFQMTAAPDRPSGDWKGQYTAHDPALNPTKYPPEFVKLIAGKWVADWYEAQTHKAGSWRNEHIDEFLSTMWQLALRKWDGTLTPEDIELEKRLLAFAPRWVGAQFGQASPLLPDKCMDGRAAGMFMRDGTPWRAGIKYALWRNDQNKPNKCVMIEGLELEKGTAFTEMNGRDLLKQNGGAEKAAGRFEGRYQRPNGWDWEHQEIRKLLSIAILTGDVNATDNLHFILENVLSNPKPHHSTRVWALNVSAALGGRSYFQSDQGPYQQDSIRYLHWARDMLVLAEKDVVRPQNGYPHAYMGFYSRGYSNLRRGDGAPQTGGEAVGMLGQALWACLEGWHFDSDAAWKVRWLAMARHCVKCFMQPGVYDRDRGGIIDTYPLAGPYPAEGEWANMTVGERLEQRVKDAGGLGIDRSYIDWQGTKLIPALCWYYHVIQDPDVPEELVRELWIIQGNKSIAGSKMLSTSNPWFWGEGHLAFQSMGQPFGTTEGLEDAPPAAAPEAETATEFGKVLEWDPAYSDPADKDKYNEPAEEASP